MKTCWKSIVIASFLGMAMSCPLFADPPEPPPPPSGHGQNGNAPVGAPIDGGLGILLALGAVYGGKKAWNAYTDGRGISFRRAGHLCETKKE